MNILTQSSQKWYIILKIYWQPQMWTI